MSDPRVSRLIGAAAGIVAVAAGAVLAVRPFASVEVMELAVCLGLAVAALVEWVQVRRERPAKVTLAIGFTVAAAIVGLWQPASLPVASAVAGLLMFVAGGAELWSTALLSKPDWPRLLNSPSQAGRWPSLLVGSAWIVLGAVAMVWVDRTVLPAAVALGMYLLIAGLGLLSDAWFPDHRLGRAPDRARIAGRGLAIVVGSALAFAGFGLDGGRVAPGPFYASGTATGHSAGKLLRADARTGAAASGMSAARLLYVTTTAQGSPTVASATIYVPAGRAAEQLPLAVWVPEGIGLSPSCAPSVRGLAAGGLSFLDQVAAAGYALLVPDLPGLGVEGESSYLIGQVEGRGVLDALRAVRQLDGVRFGDAVLWGNGQGGHAALWAGLIRDDYAPEVALEGVAALAPLTDLVAMFGAADDGPERERAQAYLISSYAQAYPEVHFNGYVRSSAWLRVRETAARCQDRPGPLLDWLQPLEPGLAWVRPATEGPLGTRLATNRPDGRIPVPVFLAQGGADQVITKNVQDGYVADQCRRGTGMDYRVYGDRDHQSLISANSPAIADLLAWTADRLDGLEPVSTCG